MVRNGTNDGAAVSSLRSASQVSFSASVGELLADFGSLFLQSAMGWFFGCFGRGRKDRKQGNRAPSVNHKPSPTPAPVRMPTAASIPIIKVPVRGSGCEDLFGVRKVCGSLGSARYRINDENSRLLDPPVFSPSPARRADGVLIQETLTVVRQESTPCDSSKAQSLPTANSGTDPSSQLDILEQELDDIRNQIDRESDDAKKIKDEVAFLKSCGTLLQTPAEIKNRVPSPERQNMPESVPTSWRSWLLPPSPTSKPEVNTKHMNEDLRAPLCAPTPAKECHALLRGVKTPDIQGSTLRRAQVNLESCLEALPQAISEDGSWATSQQEKVCSVDDSLSFNEKMVQSIYPPASVTYPKASSDARPESQEQQLDVSGRPCVSVERKPASTVGMDRQRLRPKANAESASPSCLENRSSNQVEDRTADYFQHAVAVDNLVKRRSQGCTTAREVPQNHNQWIRDSTLIANEEQTFPRADSSPCHQKRLKILPAAHSIATATSTDEDPSKPAGLHLLRGSKCAMLSPIHESGVSMDESASCCKESFRSSSPRSVKARQEVDACENITSPSHSISHSPLITGTRKDSVHCPISWAKSVSFTPSHSDNGAAQVSDSIAMPDVSYFKSSLAEKSDGYRFDSSEIHISSCIAQEDGISPLSPSRRERLAESNICDGESAASAAEKSETGKQNIRGFEKYAVWNQESQPDYEIIGDDFDLFIDAVSLVSPECIVRDEGVPGCADSLDSLNTEQLCNAVEPVYLVPKTPLKLCEFISTPEIVEAGKHWRLRSKPISSVVIPVENLSQWNRLKETKNIVEDSSRLNKTDSKTSSARQILASTVSAARKESWDENKHGERSGDLIRVDTSLSHWLKPSFPKESCKSSGSHRGNHTPPGLVQGQRSPRGIGTERQTLGAATYGDRCGWDGMGIPNSTTKYKEDQKVNWHETPFEVRLERALDKQGVALQKKLFEGASAAAKHHPC